jgi:hypothetical protein
MFQLPAAGNLHPVVGFDRSERICPICGDRIGTYEPVIATSDEGARQTSLAGEPDLADSDVTLAHAECAEDAGPP